MKQQSNSQGNLHVWSQNKQHSYHNTMQCSQQISAQRIY